MKKANSILISKTGSVLDAIFEVNSVVSATEDTDKRSSAIKATIESLSRQMANTARRSITK